MAFLLSLYDTHLQLFDIGAGFVPVDGFPILRPKVLKFSRKERPDGSLPAFAWDNVATPIRSHYRCGLRFFHPALPALPIGFPYGRLSGTGPERIRAYHVPRKSTMRVRFRLSAGSHFVHVSPLWKGTADCITILVQAFQQL